MADFEAIGKALQIPQSVLNNIDKIDQKINLIASDSEKMATHFMSAMTRMGTGADGLLKKLQSIQGVINGLGNVNIGGLGSVSKGMGSTATQAEKAAASISQAASALNRFVETWKGSGRVTSMLDSLATREQVNLLRELNNQAMQTSRTLTQANRENALSAKQRANETKIASQEETNATNRKMAALKQENAQIKINSAEYRNYVSALTMSESSENSRLKKIERMNTVLSELQRKEALYSNEIEITRKKIEQLTRENESLARVRDKANKQRTDERTNTQALNAYNRAMSASEALVTQRINKIAKLRQAEEMLRNASGNYATQLNRISQEIARLNRLNQGMVDQNGRIIRSQRQLMNTSEQLTRQLALVFSVSAIEGYIMKLVQVRGEFELQQTALASILQNKDKADQLFGQITELAVKSPFTLKELTTYTKSLAAYQVQYEDLYDTTKMLADVSAGLGVDMQRLILAFGQVKAANILRGCLGYGTPVMLYDGTIKQVQDIVVGDVLINEKGEPVNILELIRGRETMFLVEQVSGHNRTSYRVNRNHILTLWNVQEQRLEDVYVYDYLKNTEAYLGIKIVGGEKIYYDIEVTKDRIDDYYGFVLDGNKRFRLGDGTITHNTEVRQFTEAGLNILGELAKYYSELEGRMISVGEVQDMVTRRMVSFGDVEEVLKRVTSAGGIFYDMQERQSQTLAGMMSNLRDNLDLMFNDIGKSNDSVIKDVVKTIADLIKNWREVAWYVEKVAIAFVAYRSVVALATLGNSKFVTTLFNISTMSGTATTRIQALGKALAGVGRGLAVGGVVLLVSWLTDLIREATRAQRESERLSASLRTLTSMDAGNLNKTISALDDLLARYKLSNEGSQERRDIISALNSNYGEYLNFIVDETTTLEQLTTAYDEVIKRMKERSSLATLEKGYQEINQSYEEQISEGRKQLEKELSKGLRVKVGAGFTKNLLPTEEDINNIFNLLQQRIRESNEEELKGSREQRNLLQEIVTKYYSDKDLYLSQDYMKTIPLVDAFIQKKEKEAELESNINSAYKQTMQTREANLAMQERELKYEEEKKKIQGAPLSSFETQRQLQEASKQYELDKIDIQLQFGEISEASAKRAKDAIIHWATATTEDINKNLREKLSEFTEEDISRVLVTPEVQSQGVTSLIQETITQYKAQNSIIEQQEQLKKAGLRIDENVLENAKKLLAMYKARGEVLGIDWSSIEDKGGGDGGSKNPELDKLKEQVAMIEKAAKAYEDYRKLYDEETAQRMVETAFAKPFENLDLNFAMTFDAQGIIEAYRKLAQSVGGDAQEYIEGKIAEGLTDVTTDQRTKEVEEYRKRIDELFQSLENYQELEKLGLNKELISQLFGINVSSINDVQDAFEKMKDSIKGYGKEGEKLISYAEKNITDAQQKELDDRLKKYAEYLTKSLDQIQNVQREAGIDIQYAGMLFGQGKLDSEQYSQVIKNVISEMNSEISKINVEKFKESSEYIKAMGDLSLYSKNELRQLAEQIQRLISDSAGKIDASDLKVYQDALDNINDNIREIDSPFKNNPISEFKELVRIQDEFNEEKKRFNELLKKRNELEIQLEQAKIELERLRKMQEEEPNKDFSSNISNTQNNIKDIVGQIGSMNNQLNFSQGMMSNLSSQAGGMMDNQQITMAKIDKIIKSVYNTINSIVEQFEELKELAETFGAETDKGIWNKLSISFNAISEMNENVMSSWESYKSGDYVGASVKAVSAVFSVIKGINALHDNKREEKIQKELDLIEDLQHAYEKLEKAIDDAYSLDQYQKAYDMSKENLEQQREALQESIRLEEDKKKTDKDRIKEWEQQIDDIEEQLEELAEEQFSTATAGILDSVLSAADEFTNAWLEAFRETGEGMTGLEENFQEMLENMLKRQASMTITSSFIDRWKKQLEQYINEDDMELTTDEAKKWVDSVTSSLPALNEALESYFKAMQDAGFDLTQTSEGDTLSGLQRGVTTITEQTAEVLASILESIRFFVSDQNTVIHNIYNTLVMPTEENPFLSELRLQTEQLRLMYNLWNGVIKTQGGSGRAVNVRIV